MGKQINVESIDIHQKWQYESRKVKSKLAYIFRSSQRNAL